MRVFRISVWKCLVWCLCVLSTNGAIARVVWAAERPITLVTEEMEPFNFTEGVIVRGFATEIVTSAFKAAGIAYNLEVLPWPRAYDRALHDPNVFIFSMARIPEREKLFTWVHALAPARVCLFRLASRDDLRGVDTPTLSAWNVSAIRGYFTVEVLARWGVPASSLFLFPDDKKPAVIEHLERGRSDFFLGDPLIFGTVLEKVGKSDIIVPHAASILVGDYYLAANLVTPPDVVEKVRGAIRDMFDSGKAQAIRDSYVKVAAP